MKNKRTKNLLIIVIFFHLAFLLNAQKDNFSTAAFSGLSTPILDNGIGLHLGINPSYSLFSHLSIEGQISYVYTNITGSFISGNEAKTNAFNTLLGGRLYFNSESRKTRFYINLLMGGNYNVTYRSSEKMTEYIIGLSGGGYVEREHLLFGISFDTPQNLILKIGYVF